MAKPIFIIGINFDTAQEYDMIIKSLESKLNDYHVLVYMSNAEKPSFQAFYEKDFNYVKYEELKQIIEKEVINAPNKNI